MILSIIMFKKLLIVILFLLVTDSCLWTLRQLAQLLVTNMSLRCSLITLEMLKCPFDCTACSCAVFILTQGCSSIRHSAFLMNCEIVFLLPLSLANGLLRMFSYWILWSCSESFLGGKSVKYWNHWLLTGISRLCFCLHCVVLLWELKRILKEIISFSLH